MKLYDVPDLLESDKQIRQMTGHREVHHMLLSTFLYTFQTFHGKSLKSFQQIEKNTSFLLSLQIKFRSFYGSKIYKYSLIFNITWMALWVSYRCQKLRHSNNFSKILAILTKKLPLPAKERKKKSSKQRKYLYELGFGE